MAASRERMNRLERELRLHRALLLGALAIAVFAAAAGGGSDEVRTGRLAVVNGEGRAVVVLEASPEGHGSLVLHDRAGGRALSASVQTSGDGLLLIYNGDQAPIVEAGGAVGSGRLVLSNHLGKPIVMGRSEYGNGAVRVFDREGALGATLNGLVGSRAGGGVHVFAGGGRLAAVMRADDGGQGYVGAFDAKGNDLPLGNR